MSGLASAQSPSLPPVLMAGPGPPGGWFLPLPLFILNIEQWQHGHREQSPLRCVALFGILFSQYFLHCFQSSYYYRGSGLCALKAIWTPRLPVLTPMSGSRGVVTLLAHISPACSTQPSISNVPPAPADNNFSHYKYPASTQPPGAPNIEMAKDRLQQ